MKVGVKALSGALMAVFCLLPVSLAAAAPVNDDFAVRQALTGLLPIEATGSNIGATKESGESLSVFAAGHSVWFEWQATETGWVTIGSCASGFPSIVAIFTGSGIGSLTPVVHGNAREGPGCTNSQSQYTFRAVAGTEYEIAVDGNAFAPPGAPAPVTEGNVALRIERALPPPNDLFVSPGVVSGRIDEEPGGSRFYFAAVKGHNWGATTEPGEPIFGSSSGASVWYSWTPPESGNYMLNGPCCSAGLGWAVYTGDSLGNLVTLPPPAGPVGFAAVAGTPYRIAIYGTPDAGTGEPTMASFQLLISARLSPGPGASPPSADGGAPPLDKTAPGTTISRKVLKRKPPIFTFAFGSSEPGSSFRCSLDGAPFKPCGRSRSFRKPSIKRHTLRVYAVDAAGNADPTPAVAHFRIRPLG